MQPYPQISDELADILEQHIHGWPSLYQTGGDVLEHMLCSYSGFEWDENGDLVDVMNGDEPLSDHDLSSFENWLKSINISIDSDRSRDYWYAIYSKEKYAFDHSIVVAHDSNLTYEFYRRPSDEEYCPSPITCIPDNVSPVWGEACDVMFELMDIYPDYYEQEEIKRYKMLQASLEVETKKLEKTFFAKFRKAIEDNNRVKAEALFNRCPDQNLRDELRNAIIFHNWE